jgi:hypothetical protein
MTDIYTENSPKKAAEKPLKEVKTNVNSIGTGCNLEREFSEEDERLLSHIQLTEEQLKLRSTDQEAFWKSVAETLRTDLVDCLDENQEVTSGAFICVGTISTNLI